MNNGDSEVRWFGAEHGVIVDNRADHGGYLVPRDGGWAATLRGPSGVWAEGCAQSPEAAITAAQWAALDVARPVVRRHTAAVRQALTALAMITEGDADAAEAIAHAVEALSALEGRS